ETEGWWIGVRLWNAAATTYRIDAADVRVVLGGIDRTSTYTLVRQTALGAPIAPAAQDTLVFLVTHTGNDTGAATLEASVQATDLVSGRIVEVNTFLGGKGSLPVQAPGLP